MRFGAAFWINRTELAGRSATAASPSRRPAGTALWIDDHLLSDEGDARDPKLEGWATLAALAVLTERVRLGLLVGANTFRNPGLTAKLATTAGPSLGRARPCSGSAAAGSSASTTPSGSISGRVRRAARSARRGRAGSSAACSMAIGSRTTAASTRCTTPSASRDPVQARLPILIGGSGPTKTLRTTARYADLWNGYGPPERIADDERDPAHSAALRSAGRSRRSSGP